MLVETNFTAVESLIAEHVATSFKEKKSPATDASTAAQIRNCITDRLKPVSVSSDQDNSPPAVLVHYNQPSRAFSLTPPVGISQVRASRLDLLHRSLEELRLKAGGATRGHSHPAPIELILERQQLALKNELTEGFGRLETWFVSITAFALVLLNAIDVFWALPVLALSIGRSLHLDWQCKKRSLRMAEIDTLAAVSARRPHA